MKHGPWVTLCLMAAAGNLQAQQIYPDNTGYGDTYLGPASIGSQEPLYRYDDQERWKHGYIQAMPFYGGYRAFLPYNYHNVFGQSQTAAGWGMSPVLPYSQQFWHRYEHMTDLSRGHHTPLVPYVPPVEEWDHYPKPVKSSTSTQGAPMQFQPPPAPLTAPDSTPVSQIHPTSGMMAQPLYVPPAAAPATPTTPYWNQSQTPGPALPPRAPY